MEQSIYIKKWCINICLLILVAMITIGTLEIILHFTPLKKSIETYGYPLYYFEDDPDFGYDISKNAQKTRHTFKDYSYDIWSNDLGCFDKPYNGDEPYILILGDSFAWGYAPFEDKYGTVIERETGIRVLKCGVSGYGTKQEFLKAKRIVSRLRKSPELILLQYCYNDAKDDFDFPNRRVIDGYLVDAVRRRLDPTGTLQVKNPEQLRKEKENYLTYCTTDYPEYPSVRKVTCYLKKHSIVYVNTTNAIKSISAWMKIIPPPSRSEEEIFVNFQQVLRYPWVKEELDKHFDNLSAFKDLAAQRQLKFLVVMTPLKNDVYSSLKNASYQSRALKENNWHTFLLSQIKQRDINPLDLLPAFRLYANQSVKNLDSQRDLFWRYDNHWNIKGNHLAGLLASQYLLENNLIEVYDKEGRLRTIDKKLKTFR